ncbi:1-phosphofructokinase [Spiroplasma platyhelix]|uniref:1-phosphofructokinase n=1 Tax=Spiroplasma platyhelix PALS-1 TaxID=1276218 RepID=A0A846U1F8_9MOLU|nr:1-phosphofructokinase [Spiroplasma platyhelix]MBE4704273.1 Tagatose-6-phosphate kinase [Spiroplasma platyhelix PALS-1]NKE38646.1 1-phosphofructokinase [Spiroplasma platyhelix PALS-1]UJB28857.1 1-phosphofructokinase [Spiroplasma platyhelix PALS-1]
MIYTLTLNPAIDQMISVPNFQLGATNKAKDQYQILGGKGVNVSVMLQNLGHKNMALGFMAQGEAAQFESYLKTKEVVSDFHKIAGHTRLNLKIRDLSNNQETELNCLGFSISDTDEKALMDVIKKYLTKEDILIMSGSIAPGSSKNLYQTIAQFCSENQITFAIDATKEVLLSTLQYHPLLIKPNLAELNEIFSASTSFNNIEEVTNLAKKLLSSGAQNVLISNGGQGSLLVTKDQSYLANAAKGTLVNSVGAGDSMVAGFVGTYSKTKDIRESLLVASAAGAATAFCQGIGDLDLVEKLKAQIKITP